MYMPMTDRMFLQKTLKHELWIFIAEPVQSACHILMFTRQYPCPFIILMRPSYISIPIYLQTVNRSFYKQKVRSVNQNWKHRLTRFIDTDKGTSNAWNNCIVSFVWLNIYTNETGQNTSASDFYFVVNVKSTFVL